MRIHKQLRRPYLCSSLDDHVVGKPGPEFICDQVRQDVQLVMQIVSGQVVDLHIDGILQAQPRPCFRRSELHAWHTIQWKQHYTVLHEEAGKCSTQRRAVRLHMLQQCEQLLAVQ